MNRTKLSKDKLELLNNFIDKRIKESYNQFYTGKIIDNNDPEKLGRCKIRVFGVFGEEIPNEDLPWAIPNFNFIGSTLGSFVVPPIDAIVKVEFDSGNLYAPVYTTKVININKLPSDKDEDYPHTMVLWETDEGEYLKINRKTNETTYHSASGVLLTFDSDGNVELNTEECDNGEINFITKTGYGLKVNGKYLVTEEYLNWFFQNSAKLVLTPAGPGSVFPDALSSLTTKYNTPDTIRTNK